MAYVELKLGEYHLELGPIGVKSLSHHKQAAPEYVCDRTETTSSKGLGAVVLVHNQVWLLGSDLLIRIGPRENATTNSAGPNNTGSQLWIS